MTLLDVLVIVWAATSAGIGLLRGLLVQVASLVGLVGGAIAASRLAPAFLEDGSASPWLPLAGLVGAVIGGTLLGWAGRRLRGRLAFRPLELIDAGGGFLAGAALGLAVAWLFAALALLQPALGLREVVQRSTILPALTRAAPPETVLKALNRFDPLPLIAAAPDAGLGEPRPALLESSAVQEAGLGVVKVLGTSCGLGLQGSGWVVRPGLVATNAHVIAGERDTYVVTLEGRTADAEPVYVDRANDVALLRTAELGAPTLQLSSREPRQQAVALLGYPGNGPLEAVAGTAGAPRTVFAPDAYERRLGRRTVIPLRGGIRRGDSGGPVVDRRGRVVTMMFAAARGREGGFGVPLDAVRRGLRSPLEPVSSGPCLG